MQSYNVFGTTFDVPPAYTQLKAIGMGTFGLVCSAFDTVNNQKKAIKKIANPYQNAVLAKRCFRELLLLVKLRHCENIVFIQDVFESPKSDLYLVTEYMDTDLARLLAHKQLEPQHVKYFTYQILVGLKYVHSAGVIHRDLKPSNLLINGDGELRICDFGLARVKESLMTGYVATRYYRAPEIMLTWQRYGNAVDIWSVGCILGEMMTGKPVFPGRDHVEQFSMFSSLLGSPPAKVVESISSANTLQFVQSLHLQDHASIRDKFKEFNQDATDLLCQMLNWDPQGRITAKQALDHPYLAEFHDPEFEPESDSPFDWSFTEEDISVEQWHERIRRLIAQVKP
ncbi:kinase-like domain-containing protein [Gorgonomyces haynaldii]|nr:kinase-like domain-containing protein [Gorgonomyces haynaldii]